MFYPIYFYSRHLLSVLYLNIKKCTLALASDVQLIISRRFVIREKKLDGLVCRVSMDIFDVHREIFVLAVLGI